MKEQLKDFKKHRFAKVFVRKYPWDIDTDIYPAERQNYINDSNNIKVRQQRLFVWKLLEYVIEQDMGLDMSKLKFDRVGGRWICDEFEFSLSHTGNIVAVAISDKPIGVDIEFVGNEKFERLKSSSFCCEEEIKTGNDNAMLWTAKEAIFKSLHKTVFRPLDIDSTQYDYSSYRMSNDNILMCVAGVEDQYIDLVIMDDLT